MQINFWDRKKCDKVPCAGRAFFPTCHFHTLYKTFAWQTFISLRLFTCLVYVNTYGVPIAHLHQNKPFPLLYLGHAQITRRCGSVYLGVVVLRVCEVCYVYEGYVGSAVVLCI